MFPRLNLKYAPRIFTVRHIVCVALLLLAPLSVVTRGQGVGSSRGEIVGSTGGMHTISGRVYFPTGAGSSQPRLKVTLEGSNVTARSTTTDGNGTFLFTGLLPGTYTIVVEGGADYDDARDSAYIETSATTAGNIGRQDIKVQFTMRPKGSGAGASSNAFAGVPKPALDLYNKALESSKKNDNKKAVEQLKEAVALHPKFAIAYNEMGMQYLKLSQPAEAVAAFDSALKITPDALIIRLNYGIALMEKKDYPEAEKQLREVIKKNDNSPMGHLYLGITLLRARKTDEAELELKRAITLGKNDVAIAHYYLGGIYWGKKDYKQAADELETYLKLTPKAPGADKIRETIKQLRDQQKTG